MSIVKINQSVGIGGANTYNDIKSIQIGLNKILNLIPPTKVLAEDGSLGRNPENSNTVAAIKVFQKKVVNMVRPDGRIDPNGRTLRMLKSKVEAAEHSKAPNNTAPLLAFSDLQFPFTFIPQESYKVRPRSFGCPRGSRKHAGCDLYAPEGTPIYAMADGEIVIHRPFLYDTYQVVIKTGKALIRYAEINKDLPNGLKIGSKVKKGDHIANVGLVIFPSGNQMSMLHLEMYAGTTTGELYDGSSTANAFRRRADLMDPTEYIDRAKKCVPVVFS